jgi:hypothetical protein
MDPPPASNKSDRITFKGGLRGLLRQDVDADAVTALFTGVAKRASALATRALFLVKLLLLHKFGAGEPLPQITHTFMLDALKVVGRPSRRVRASAGQDELAAFYDEHFRPQLPAGDEPPSYEFLGDALGYIARSLVAAVETNIEQHFVEYVEAYVNACFDKRGTLARIEDERRQQQQSDPPVRIDYEAEASTFLNLLRAIKTDLLNVNREPRHTPQDLHGWIDRERGLVLPNKEDFTRGLVAYDVACHPQDYLLPMLRMTRAMESMGARLRNVVPLRTTLVPMHVTFDTLTLVRLFHASGVFNHFEESKTKLEHDFAGHKDDIWSALFQTDDARIFHSHDYAFDHMIRTDGVSCCVIHARRGLEGAARPKGKRRRKRKKKKRTEKYIDELTEAERASLQGAAVVGIDPGINNLLFCSMDTDDGAVTYRYTQAQRRFETKARHYANVEHEAKKSADIEGRSVVQWESTLSAHNFKTVDVERFKACIRAKLAVYEKLGPFYAERLWRKMRLNGYWARGRSERKMVADFRAAFGAPPAVVVGMGDWAQRGHCKFKEPVKGKGLRDVLRRAGYRVLLVDEFRTSIQCSSCQAPEAVCSEFLRRSDEDAWLDHGLLRCQSCKRRWKRDANGAANMARLTRAALAHEARPAYLSRQRPRRRRRDADADDADQDNESPSPGLRAAQRPRAGSVAMVN